MTVDVSGALPFGSLERTEVFFEHDGPRLFALRSVSLDVRLIGICIEDDDDSEEVVFLYVAMSARRFREVRSGHIALREAMSAAGPWELWRVIEDYGPDEPEVRAERVSFRSLSEADLPSPDARLSLPTPTSAPLDAQELLTWSAQAMRTLAVIELDAVGQDTTEFPLRNLGLVGSATQETLDALAQEETGDVTERGAIKRSVTDDVQMSAVALRAASFALVIGTDMSNRLIENTDSVEATLQRLAQLIDAGSDSEALVTSMRGYGARARSKFVGLLRAVNGAGSGIGLVAAPLNGSPFAAHMTRRQVAVALSSIGEVSAALQPLTVRRAVLTGSNTRLNTFELVDMATGARFSGKVDAEARGQIDGLEVGSASFVTAELLEEVDFAAEDQETGRRYRMTSITALQTDN